MFETLNIIGVGAATIAGYAIGMLWYSPLFFMKPWLSALGKNEGVFKRPPECETKSYMWGVMSYSFVITFATAFALSMMITLVDPKTFAQTLELSMLICFGFIVTTKFSEMLYDMDGPHWGMRAQKLFLINTGYYVVMFLVMGTILHYLA